MTISLLPIAIAFMIVGVLTATPVLVPLGGMIGVIDVFITIRVERKGR